jgi:UDP-N-acetylglucosamine enolpyruvyl transferase
MAKGRSVIKGAEVIDRGYENIEEKLSKLGANITRSDG